MAEQLTGAQILCRALLEEGVDLLFGYPGGAIMPFYHALPEYPGLRHVLVRHEQAAAHAADGYARASGRPGVCVATSGPGATNLVTGIATAHMDSTPAGRHHRPGAARDDRAGTRSRRPTSSGSPSRSPSTAAWSRTSSELADAVHEAFAVAREGRPGPVLLDVPKDVQNQKAECDGRGRRAAGPTSGAPDRSDRAARTALVEAAAAHRRVPSGRSSWPGTASS